MFAFDGKEQTKQSVKNNIFSVESNNTITINFSNLKSGLENYLKTAQEDYREKKGYNQIFIIAYFLSNISTLKLPPTILNNNQTIDPVSISNDIKRTIEQIINNMVKTKQFDPELKKIIDTIANEINKPSGKYNNPWDSSPSVSSFFELVINGQENCPDPKTIYQEKDQITEAEQVKSPSKQDQPSSIIAAKNTIDLNKIPKKNQEDQSLKTKIDLNQNLDVFIRNVQSIFFTFNNGGSIPKSTVPSDLVNSIATQLRAYFQGFQSNQNSKDTDKLRKAFMFFCFYYLYYNHVRISQSFTTANSSEDATNFQKIINFFKDLKNGKKPKEGLNFLYSGGDAYNLYFKGIIEQLK